jgi:hypothetical protein
MNYFIQACLNIFSSLCTEFGCLVHGIEQQVISKTKMGSRTLSSEASQILATT